MNHPNLRPHLENHLEQLQSGCKESKEWSEMKARVLLNQELVDEIITDGITREKLIEKLEGVLYKYK